MGEFFKPWRRKFGVVTLVMACGLAILWFRSQTKMDSLSFRVGNEHHRLSSSRNYGLAWEIWIWDDGNTKYVQDGQYSHAAIVIPLTLLSALLLLSKPRTKPSPGTEREIIPPTSAGPDKDPTLASASAVAADH